MQVEVTFEDPKTFTRPITVTVNGRFFADTEMLEFVCNENEKDLGHLVGRASDEIKGNVKVGADALARYTGSYKMADGPMPARITVSGDQLMFGIGGKGAVPLTTLSETSFYFPGGFPIDFVMDDKGGVAYFLFHAPGPDMKFVPVASDKR
jgi:hypothetical protein